MDVELINGDCLEEMKKIESILQLRIRDVNCFKLKIIIIF